MGMTDLQAICIMAAILAHNQGVYDPHEVATEAVKLFEATRKAVLDAGWGEP